MAQGYPGAQPFGRARYPGLAGKVVLDTGAGSGIGRAMAHAFAGHGATLMLLDIDGERLRQVEAELRRAYPDIQVACAAASVTDPVAVEQACEQALERFGRIDVLLNNAGISMNQPALDLSVQDWQRAMDINLNGVFYCSQAAGRHMEAGGGGTIVNMASMWGLSASARRLAYCVSKAGVVSLTQCLAAEWAGKKIRVNAICPGYVQTALMEELVAKGALDARLLCQKTPMNRLGQPEEVAEAALYLASDAAAFITGHSLVIDGGWLADGF